MAIGRDQQTPASESAHLDPVPSTASTSMGVFDPEQGDLAAVGLFPQAQARGRHVRRSASTCIRQSEIRQGLERRQGFLRRWRGLAAS